VGPDDLFSADGEHGDVTLRGAVLVDLRAGLPDLDQVLTGQAHLGDRPRRVIGLGRLRGVVAGRIVLGLRHRSGLRSGGFLHRLRVL
jgi:hypothetical protein